MDQRTSQAFSAPPSAATTQATMPGNSANGIPQPVPPQAQYFLPPQLVLQGKPLAATNFKPCQPQQTGGTALPMPYIARPPMPNFVSQQGSVYTQQHLNFLPQVASAGSIGHMVQHPHPGSMHGHYTAMSLPMVAVNSVPMDERPSSSHSANTSAGGLGSEGSPQEGGSAGTPGSMGAKSRYRGVSYDRKKAKWRVQIKVAALGKSGVSVGYYDTEEAAARAYDRAAIGLLGRDNPNLQTNFQLADYADEPIPPLTGKSREEVKTTLKSERIKQAPRRRFTSRQRTSRFMGVGSSNRKNQWQARILVHGKVTHLGYYETEEEAAKVYDRVSLALHGDGAQTNFPAENYPEWEITPYRGLDREDLQRALGVKPMDKSSRFRGVSKKKGKWEAKVMVNRRWAYRELFDSEEEAARAYDRALWRLKPREAHSYVNFKDEVPEDALAGGEGELHGDGGPGRHAASEGDLEESDLGDDDELSDDGDFEYEYRPIKGTRRSSSMRAKRAGSMPNLASAAAGAPSRANPAGSSQTPCGPGFVAIPGGGLQLQFGGGSTMVPVADEPFLISVGSETHVLQPSAPPSNSQTLGKRTGIQRIKSEPFFSVAREPELVSVPGIGDVHDLINDRDLFRSAYLGELNSSHGMNMNTGGGEAGDGLNSFAMDFMHADDKVDGLAGLLFEDEELALANLEFNRPRKMSKSMSMSQLSSLVDNDAQLKTLNQFGKPPPGPPTGSPQGPILKGQRDSPDRLGPLGQPIRRTNTFTSSLPSFEEGEERLGHDAPPPLHMSLGHQSSEALGTAEDLVKQFLDPPAPGLTGSASLDDAMQMIGEA